MLRRVTSKAAAPVALAAASQQRTLWFSDAKRRPQLSPEERAKVEIDQSTWPAMWKDWDPADPYKNVPNWIEGMGTFNWAMFGAEVAFIVVFWECCFPETVAL